MKNKELKKIIKQLVRESLTEIFAEMKLEQIVENAVKKQNNNKNNYSLKDTLNIENNNNNNIKKYNKDEVMKNLGIDESMWESIYSDTVENNIVAEGEETNDKPELVSASQLEQAGLMKDYSAYIGGVGNNTNKKVVDNSEPGDYQNLLLERKKMLASKISYR